MNFFAKLFHTEKKKKFICKGAFSQVHIYHDGRVFLCPDCYMPPEALIGNLNEKSFEEIWNSEKAQLIRKNAKDMIYRFCNPKSCYVKTNYHIRVMPSKDIDFSVKQKKYPQMVCVGPDWECNVNCVMCRPALSRLTDEELSSFNKKIDEWYLPILKDARELTLSTTSDPFGSRCCRELMKRASEKYPKLKFNIMTNGILCDKFNCEQVRIWDKMGTVMFSIHASNKEVYDRVVKNGNFEKMRENLKLMSELKSECKIKALYLGFVVSAKNYENIPDFCEFARSNNAVALFWMCRDWGGNLDNSDEPLEVWRKEHPKFRDLQGVLRSIPVLDTEYSNFNPYLKYIRDNDL